MDLRLRPLMNLLLIPAVIGILWFYAHVRSHPIERRAVEAEAAFFPMVHASAFEAESTVRLGEHNDNPARRDFSDLDEIRAEDMAAAADKPMFADLSAEADGVP